MIRDDQVWMLIPINTQSVYPPRFDLKGKVPLECPVIAANDLTTITLCSIPKLELSFLAWSEDKNRSLT